MGQGFVLEGEGAKKGHQKERVQKEFLDKRN